LKQKWINESYIDEYTGMESIGRAGIRREI
jgi:hypothetical protein